MEAWARDSGSVYACAAGVVGKRTGTTSSEKQCVEAPVGNVCACASVAGSLGRSGHHLKREAEQSRLGATERAAAAAMNPRIVSAPPPAPCGAASISRTDCTLTGVVRPGQGCAAPPHPGLLLPLTSPLTSGSCPPSGPRDLTQHPEFSHTGLEIDPEGHPLGARRHLGTTRPCRSGGPCSPALSRPQFPTCCLRVAIGS